MENIAVLMAPRPEPVNALEINNGSQEIVGAVTIKFGMELPALLVAHLLANHVATVPVHTTGLPNGLPCQVAPRPPPH
jgi:hypothetical protein